MSDQGEINHCSSATSRLLSELLTSLPIEQPTSTETGNNMVLTSQPPTSSNSPHIPCTPAMASLTTASSVKSKILNNSNDMGPTNVKKQPSPSTPSTAIDFFTFKWLFKKRTVPFLKKSSSSIFPEASETGHHLLTSSNSGGMSTPDGNGLGGARSNSRSAGSRLDCQSIPGTAKPSKICNVTPVISRLAEESTLKSTLRMKLSYSFGDIDEFSKWSNTDNAEQQPLNFDSTLNDDHQYFHHSNNSRLVSTKCIPKENKLISSSSYSSASVSHFPVIRRSNFGSYSHRGSFGGTKVRKIDSSLNLSRSSIEKCFLCLNDVKSPSMHTIWSCGCRFCINCLRTYLTINIKENNNVCNLTCPDSNCPELAKLLKQHQPNNLISSSSGRMMNSLIRTMSPNRFTPQEIQLLVSSEIFDLYKKYKLYQEVDEDPNRTWCPKPNCCNICIISKPNSVSLPTSSSFTSSKSTQSTKTNIVEDKASFYCQKCKETYCNLCRKSYHPGTSCWPSGEDDDLALLLNNQDSSSHCVNNIKRCPRCSVWIERDDGCAQMMCRKCKHVFCWFCLQSLEDDFLLRHYDKGPCKNKLGHSRPSVIWHRTQVIAIFAGFGLLLLLASPLFLIASPCILCCNCCCGSSCKYLDDGDPNEEEDGFGVVNL